MDSFGKTRMIILGFWKGKTYWAYEENRHSNSLESLGLKKGEVAVFLPYVRKKILLLNKNFLTLCSWGLKSFFFWDSVFFRYLKK